MPCVVNVTTVFGTLVPEPSTSVAVSVAGELDEIELLLAASVIRATDAVPVTVKPRAGLDTEAPETVAVAVTVSAPNCVPASSEMRATPVASVSAVAPAGENVPKPVPCVAKRTSAPATSVPPPSRTVAESVAGAVDVMVLFDDVNVTRAALVVPVDV